MRSKGFALLECLLVLLVMVSLAPLALQPDMSETMQYHAFTDEYLLRQTKAMAVAEILPVDLPGTEGIHFNGAGTVNQARTVTFPGRKSLIIIELGGGRLVFR